MEGSVEVHEGSEVRFKEAFIGADGLAIGQGGEVVTEEAVLVLRVGGLGDPFTDWVREQFKPALLFAKEVFGVGVEEVSENVASLELDLLE